MIFVELILQGLIQGSIYALIAVGLTLVYGLLRILHIAHAALFTLGAYLGLLITNATGSLALGFLVAMVVVGIAGIAIYRFCYHDVLDQPPHVALIASVGLFIAMEEGFRLIWGPTSISFTEPPWQAAVVLGGIQVKTADLVTIPLAIVLIGGLAAIVAFTRIGLAWRATVTDPAMAGSFGIDALKVRYLNFFLGSALAAAAGVMFAILANFVEPTMGGVPSYKALAIIVLGGLGNVRGTLIAALMLGVIESFGTIYLGWAMDRDAIAFAFLILVLMVRPQGLFARS